MKPYLKSISSVSIDITEKFSGERTEMITHYEVVICFITFDMHFKSLTYRDESGYITEATGLINKLYS